jgi:DNA-binding CsgD family transcriptional regulator
MDPLLERELELATIAAAIERDRSGSLLLLEGAAGVGRTRLLRTARGMAEGAGRRVLRARGDVHEREFPFGVVRQLFEPLLASSSETERTALLAGPASLAAWVVHQGGEPDLAGEEAPSLASLHALYWLAVHLAARPLMIAVDDLQWSDPQSLRWLQFLIRRLEAMPIVLIMALRSGEPGLAAAPLAEIATDPGASILPLAPLSAAAVAHLVGNAFPAATREVVDACWQVTGGNPALVRELLSARSAGRLGAAVREVLDLAPERLGGTVSDRLVRLSPDALTLAQAVAVLGACETVHDAAGLAGLDPESAAEATTVLVRAEVLTETPQVTFVHPLVRNAVYRAINPMVRAEFHSRAAHLLRAVGATEAAATHLLSSGSELQHWAPDALHQAARLAIDLGSPDLAVRFLRRALEGPGAEGRGEILLDLGVAEARSGVAGAGERLREALELTADDERRGMAALELARWLRHADRLPESLALLDRVARELAGTGGRVVVRVEAELVATARMGLTTQLLGSERLARLRRSGRRGEREGEPVVLAHVALETAMRGASAAEAATLAERALAGGRLLADETSDSPALEAAVRALIVADLLDRAEEVLHAAREDAIRRNSRPALAAVSFLQADVALRRGSVCDAVELALESLRTPSSHLPSALACLVDALIERGELDDADRALQRHGVRESVPEIDVFNPLLASRGRLRIAQRRVREGLDDLLQCGRRQEAWGIPNPAFIPWRSTAALALGDQAMAVRLGGEELRLARRFGVPRPIAGALRALGLVEGGTRAHGRLREALAVLEGSPAVLERARVLIDLGEALRRSGQRADALGPLRQGLDLAHRCGARELASRGHSELVAAGARPRRFALVGREALTPTELRVAELAGEGRSNAEVARLLVVTVKTIEVHLSNAYRKLQIRSRTQLRQALSAQDEHEPPTAPPERREGEK